MGATRSPSGLELHWQTGPPGVASALGGLPLFVAVAPSQNSIFLRLAWPGALRGPDRQRLD